MESQVLSGYRLSRAFHGARAVGVIALCVVIPAALLVACSSGANGGGGSGGSASGAKVTFMLDYSYYGGHAPFALAEQHKYYDQPGLDVQIEPGQSSTVTVQTVADGKATFGFASSLQLAQMKAVDPSLDVKVIAQINQQAPWYVTYVKGRGINSPSDLSGKSWGGTPGGPPQQFYKLYMKLKGMTPGPFTGITSFYPALLAGKIDLAVDALTAYPYLEAAAKAQGLQTGYFLLSSLAPQLQSYSWALIARDDTLSKSPAMVSKFVQATLHGWQDALQDPPAAVTAYDHLLDPTANAATTAAELKYMLELVHSPAVCVHGLGWSNPSEWLHTAQLGADGAGKSQAPDATTLYTNEFLPTHNYIPAGC